MLFSSSLSIIDWFSLLGACSFFITSLFFGLQDELRHPGEFRHPRSLAMGVISLHVVRDTRGFSETPIIIHLVPTRCFSWGDRRSQLQPAIHHRFRLTSRLIACVTEQSINPTSPKKTVPTFLLLLSPVCLHKNPIANFKQWTKRLHRVGITTHATLPYTLWALSYWDSPIAFKTLARLFPRTTRKPIVHLQKIWNQKIWNLYSVALPIRQLISLPRYKECADIAGASTRYGTCDSGR